MSYLINPPTEEELIKWNTDRRRNPRTRLRISERGVIFKLLNKAYEKYLQTKEKDITVEKQTKSKFVSDCGDIVYDKQTCVHYKKLRDQHIDPITLEPVDENKAFKYYFKWNPFSGDKGQIDSDGPLCFSPISLAKYFYMNRLKNLWSVAVSDERGEQTGYYGNAVGNGPDFNIISRGDHPEWYLFRLPIIDCYMPENGNDQFITLGPKLTEKEITEIHELAQKYYKQEYKDLFSHKKGKQYGLLYLYNEYQNAIDKVPASFKSQTVLHPNQQNLKAKLYKENCKSVDNLRVL